MSPGDADTVPRVLRILKQVGDRDSVVLSDGVVTRTAFPEIRPRVEYELTPLGCSLERPIRAITAWAEDNVPRITTAREAYDRRAA